RLAQLALLLPAVLPAQTPPDLAAERAGFARWLETAPVSPYRAIYHQPFEDALVMGPGGDLALAALPAARLEQDLLRLTLETSDGRRTVPRNRDVEIGGYVLRVTGERGRSVVTVFGPGREVAVPGWYAHVPALVVEGTLEPPGRRESRRMLGLDGIEVEASLAGTFAGRLGDRPVRLTVYRMPEPGTEESELMVFFRDSTNGRGTYPAGRFLSLRPLGGNRYRADFNRARNPFCAYNGIFPCPLPWDGNAIGVAVNAGERYVEK
ncbi:MAG TPA: DUF1684 domain-containing protein, partial [Gemmatimonadales bacterium]|nr:DUF1684 domain-containing protein [Gemmatimonadales bacterium]